MKKNSRQTEQLVAAQHIALPPLDHGAGEGAALLGGTLGMLDSVKVGLSVVVGQAHTTVGELMNLKELAVMKIDRPADYPVDLVVNGNVLARGHLVVVDDHFGVQISEVAQAVQP